jgi:TolB protein
MKLLLFAITIALVPALNLPAAGIFEKNQDVGTVKHPGSVACDEAAQRYTVSGGGQNMWFATDAFHFVWKKVSGDVMLSADIAFPAAGVDPHRKAVLMVRQTLDADSAYADAALHGDGLTSLQYRETKGARTCEIQANTTGPQRLRIEKRGKYVSMSIAAAGEELRPAGGSFRLELQEPFYVGIGVCSHNDDVLEKAVFSNVQLVSVAPAAPLVGTKPKVVCTLETVPIGSKDRRAIMVTGDLIEAPNWTPDGLSLIYNSKGRLYRLAATGGAPEVIDTGFAIRCNNDHGISPDGKMLVISDQSQEQKRSTIYTLPIGGGTPQRITPLAPSYWHGWSPDGKTLAYCAERNGEFDIYTIPVGGGEEKRLTNAKGLDDGPDYSPDGQWIYFNSDRTGRMQIWRMKTDGSAQEQVTRDDFNNWFPHPSPDGKWLVFLTYEASVQGHPENKDVSLRLLPLGGELKEPEVLAKLFGGQGTINVPSWSPDSKKVAFVSYQLAH